MWRDGGPDSLSSLVRQRSSITRLNRRQAQEACVLLAFHSRAETTVHVDDDDDDGDDGDGDGRTNRRLRGKHSEYIRRSASSSRIPSTERRRARGRIYVAEWAKDIFTSSRSRVERMLSYSSFLCSFVRPRFLEVESARRILLKRVKGLGNF